MRSSFVFLALAVSAALLGVDFARKSDPIEHKIWPVAFCLDVWAVEQQS